MNVDEEQVIKVDGEEIHRPQTSNIQSSDVFSQKIKARSRTFFIDLKESSNGHFIKISEKSRGGRKSTVMMDEEDLQEFITSLTNVQKEIDSKK